MAKMNDNQKIMVVGGVALALCAAAGGGVWWAKGLVEEKQTEITTMRSEIKKAEAKIVKIPRVESDVIVLRENLHEYVKILPEEDELNDFVRIINQFVDQSGVEMKNFLPGRIGRASKSPFERYTYKFSIDATVWQFVHFLSLLERYERFVKTVDFSLASGATRRLRNSGGRDVVHKITVNVETYRYRPGKGGADVVIPNYPNKVDALRERIYEERQHIGVEGYKFDGPRGRRDIFVDPREAKGAPGAGRRGLTPADQRLVMSKVTKKIGESQTLYRQMLDKEITIFKRYELERSLRKSLQDLDTQIRQIQTKNTISHPPLRTAWAREVVEPMAQLRRALDQDPSTQDDRYASAEDMQALIKSMVSDLDSGAMQTAIDRYEAMDDRLRVPESDTRYKLALDIEGLYLRAKLALEFGNLNVQINGVCVNETGRSGAILNGVVVEEGEYIDNNLLLKTVRRDRVEFVYKGFTVVKML